MVSALLIPVIMGQSGPTIDFKDGSFEIKTARQTVQISASPEPALSVFPADRLTLAYSGREVLFDSKGLTFTLANGKTASSRLTDIASTSKLFSNQEVAELRQLFESGERKPEVSSLSGYEYIGSNLYLLARWEDKSGRPWLEAVVAYDMSQEPLQARLVGRFDGLSYASGVVDDRLESRGGQLMTFARKAGQWGLSRMNPADGNLQYSPLGEAPATVRMTPGAVTATAYRPTEYGTTIVSLVQLDPPRAAQVTEVRGSIKALIEPNYLRYTKGSQHFLMNLETATEMKPYWDSGIVHTRLGLLVWWPAYKPRRATLYEPESFRPLSTWVTSEPAPTPVPAAPPVKQPPVKPAPAKATPPKSPVAKTTAKQATTAKKTPTKKPTPAAKTTTTRPKTTTKRPAPKPAPKATTTRKPTTKKSGVKVDVKPSTTRSRKATVSKVKKS